MVSYRTLLTALLWWKAAILVFAAIATLLLPLQLAFTIWRDPAYAGSIGGIPYLVSIWANFDGFYYLGVAQRGYFVTELPFFPLYPYSIALLTELVKVLPYVLSGVVISHVSFIGALVLCTKLLALDGKRHLIGLFLIAVLTFPTSYSYGAVYNDSLFFFFATLTIYLSRTGKWGWAGAAGALATLTRLNGLALFPYLLVEYYRSPSKNRPGLHATLLVPAAFASYLFWIQHIFGSWTKLFSAMSTWGQEKTTIPFQVFWRYAKMLLYTPVNQLVWWVALAELAMAVFYITMLVWSWKKIRVSYWVFFAVSILIPMLTGTFQGMPRYGLHLYPLFLAIAMLLSSMRAEARLFYIVIMTILLAVFVTLFTRGYFIA